MFNGINYKQGKNNYYCVMASYAVAINDMLGISIHTCFEEYCKYFQVDRLEQRVEQDYLRHFANEQAQRSGYSIVNEFHERSSTEIMAGIRNEVVAQPVSMDTQRGEIEKALKTGNSRLMLFINSSKDTRFESHHSITVGFDGKSFLAYDVNGGYVHSLKSVDEIGIIGDCLLISKSDQTTSKEE